jgi:hypothetical protein
MTLESTTIKIVNMSKREERERLLGMIELVRDDMGESSYEQYAKRVLNRLIKTIEWNS